MLNYFDYRKLGDKQLEQLATNAADYRILFRTVSVRTLPINEKKFTFNANDETLLVAVPIEYDGYEMEAVLKVNHYKNSHLECRLYRDATKMTSCIPEYSISIIDKESSRTIVNDSVLKSDEYIASALNHITAKASHSRWGPSNFIKRTKLVDKKQYIFKVELKSLAPIP